MYVKILIVKFFLFWCLIVSINSPFVECDDATDSTLLDKINLNSNQEDEYRENVCAGQPICNLSVQPRKGFYKCMCDANCSFYDDCCSDSAFYNTTKKSKISFSCREEFKFYVVDSCPRAFKDTYTRTKCENFSLSDDDADTKVMKPVMDKKFRITYWNAYCARCNGIADYETFHLTYNCFNTNATYEYIQNEKLLVNVLAKAKFNSEKKRFISVHNGTEYTCSHEVITPKQLKPYLRYCEPKMVLTCSSTFDDPLIIEKCESPFNFAVYSGRIRGKGNMYKNEYCALCNGLTEFYHCQNIVTKTSANSIWNSYPTEKFVACDDSRLSHLC